jgi:putative flippase GtrA
MQTAAPESTTTPALPGKIVRFLISGGTSAAVNLGLLHLMVGVLGLRGPWREDGANLVALELSLLLQFTLCRTWIWRAPVGGRPGLWRELVAFHGAVAATSLGRILLYSLLRQVGVHYLINACLGIGLAAAVNFLLYDRVVFRARPNR